MTRYRRDESRTNEHGQIEHFARWMGGPSLSAVEGVVCDDGKTRTVEVTGDADTYFSIPARTHANGKTVSGFLHVEDGRWAFTSTGENRSAIRRADAERLPHTGALLMPSHAAIGDVVAYPAADYGGCGIGRVIGLAERDGCGNPYVDDDGSPIRRLIVLALSEDAHHAYQRHIAPCDVTGCRRVTDTTFLQWFFSGPLASTSDLIRTADYGAMGERYFAESCNPDGSLKKRGS